MAKIKSYIFSEVEAKIYCIHMINLLHVSTLKSKQQLFQINATSHGIRTSKIHRSDLSFSRAAERATQHILLICLSEI